MNPLILAAVLGRIFAAKRTCPKCHKDQIISRADFSKTVTCKFCGADIPPRKAKP